MLVALLKIGAGAGIGAGLGAMLGSRRSCETGGCSVTANSWRGAIYGGVMGLLIALTFMTPSGPMIEPDSGMIEVTSGVQFKEKVEQSADPVVVYFHAPSCGACRRVGPTMNDLARTYREEAVFLAVNTNENPELAEELAVRYLPTSIVLRNGREEGRFVGAFERRELLELLESQQTASRGP